jgi:hypothetical protein
MPTTRERRLAAEPVGPAPVPRALRLGGFSRLWACCRRPCSADGTLAACKRHPNKQTTRLLRGWVIRSISQASHYHHTNAQCREEGKATLHLQLIDAAAHILQLFLHTVLESLFHTLQAFQHHGARQQAMSDTPNKSFWPADVSTTSSNLVRGCRPDHAGLLLSQRFSQYTLKCWSYIKAKAHHRCHAAELLS